MRLCSHCSAPLTGRQQVRFCSRACAGKDNEDWSPPPPPRIPPRRRTDREVIGSVHMRWDGLPLLLSEIAALLDEPDLELRVGILAPWVEAILTDDGPLLYARTCGSDEVRAAVEKTQAVCNLQTGADAVEWRLESEAA